MFFKDKKKKLLFKCIAVFFVLLFFFKSASDVSGVTSDVSGVTLEQAATLFTGIATQNTSSVLKTVSSIITGKEVSNPESGLCPLFQPVSSIKEAIFTSNNVGVFACFYQILYVVLTIASWLVSLFMLVFDSVFTLTVVNMKTFVDSISVISVGWTAIRDMSNILFIFMLLYLAISTILQLDEHGVKHGLSRLIIGATLINFSLFFVKIPIDISNIIAIEIYNKINTSTGGIGTAMISSVNFQSVFTPTTLATESTTAKILSSLIPASSLLTNASVVDQEKSAIAFAASGSPITTFAMAIIMMAITILVFAAVIIIFVKRLLTLIMLMIFSPLAFAGMAIPNHNIEHEITYKFWGALLKESFYAPAFMMMIYLGLTILNSTGFKNGLFNVDDGASFIGGVVNVGTIINFAVIIIILIFALTVSEMMGVKGASGAIQFFDKTRGAVGGWVGRNTIGAMSYRTLEKTKFGTEIVKPMRQGINPITGKMIQNSLLRGVVSGTGNMAVSGLSKMGEGHHHDLEKRQESLKDTLNEFRNNPQKQAEIMQQMISGKAMGLGDKFTGLIQPDNLVTAKYVLTSMKSDDAANTIAFMRDNAIKTATSKDGRVDTVQLAEANHKIDHFLDYLGSEKAKEVEQLIQTKPLAYHKVKAKELIDSTTNNKNTPEESRHHLEKFRDFVGSLNDKQASSVFGGLTKSEEEKIQKPKPDGTKSDLHKAYDEIADNRKGFNYAEQAQRDATMSEFMKESIAKSMYSSLLRNKIGEKIESGKEVKGNELELFRRMLKKLDSIDESTRAQMDGMDSKQLFEEYKKTEIYSNDDSKSKYIGKENGQRVYEKPSEIEGEKDWKNYIKEDPKEKK